MKLTAFKIDNIYIPKKHTFETIFIFSTELEDNTFSI